MSEIQLSKEQAFLLSASAKTGRHLLTGPTGENADKWTILTEQGLMEELRPPFASLRAFRLTPRGRERFALSSHGEEKKGGE